MKQKSTGVATLLSFLWPGLGQLYNEQIFKGLVFGFWHLTASLSMLTAAPSQPGAVGALAIINFLFWVACMFDARKIACLYNQEERISQWRGTGKVILCSWGAAAVLAGIGVATTNLQAQGKLQIPNANATVTTQAVNPSAPQISPEEAYLPYVQLEKLESGNGYGRFDIEGYSKPQRGVYGSVRNAGDKTLKRVRLTFYFLNKKGQRIGEDSYSIVTPYAFTGNTDPLKPGYVRDFGFSVEDKAPKEWNGRFETVIDEIDFA